MELVCMVVPFAIFVDCKPVCIVKASTMHKAKQAFLNIHQTIPESRVYVRNCDIIETGYVVKTHFLNVDIFNYFDVEGNSIGNVHYRR